MRLSIDLHDKSMIICDSTQLHLELHICELANGQSKFLNVLQSVDKLF